MLDIIGLMMLAEGQPKPHRRQSESVCGAPVARFGIWVGPFQIRRERLPTDYFQTRHCNIFAPFIKSPWINMRVCQPRFDRVSFIHEEVLPPFGQTNPIGAPLFRYVHCIDDSEELCDHE
jgi:hypothetical protein